ncbi:hypothetical protein [Halobellus rarus]|uniref:HU domain-containing protein n=1 Tax=Halobellus rarus TaxID=1126237 RepID=A0ABD6CSR6_9EURY|nr:hypothetical protein [Halobellus rarus]
MALGGTFVDPGAPRSYDGRIRATIFFEDVQRDCLERLDATQSPGAVLGVLEGAIKALNAGDVSELDCELLFGPVQQLISSDTTVFETDKPPRRSCMPVSLSSQGVRFRTTSTESIRSEEPVSRVSGIGIR